MKNLIISLFVVLLAGTLFAWTNFGLELNAWLNDGACPTGCSAGPALINPFFTPCFYGALVFTLAFVLSAVLLKKSRNAA